MKKKRNIFLTALLVVAMLLTGGCGPKINSEQITKLDKADTGSDSNIPEEEQAEPLKEDNELPEDGIITTAQMKTISGEEGEYKFHGEDKSSGITYTWIYEGEKIRNPQEQKMKVSFVTDAAKVDQVKRSANNATVGIGFALEKENMAAPPRLAITLNEKWNADTVILCKMVDGVPKKMADVTIDQSSGDDSKKVTTLTFPVTEVGDTYYLVGGKTKTDSTSADAGPDGYCGDEDNGQTSAWYVFSALGFYPVCPGTDEYVLGAPLFRKATLHFENGKSLTIDAPDNSPENMYIESLKVNGVDYSRNYLTHGDLLNGGTLRFDMGSQPNMKRGTQPEDYPYSFSNELKK